MMSFAAISDASDAAADAPAPRHHLQLTRRSLTPARPRRRHLLLTRSSAAAYDEGYFQCEKELTSLVWECDNMLESLRENQLVAKDQLVCLRYMCQERLEFMNTRWRSYLYPMVCAQVYSLRTLIRGTLTRGSHVAVLQVPMAQKLSVLSAISVDKVKCGDTDESNMLAKQKEQFILNSSGGGGGSSPQSNSALRITFADTTFTTQHRRGLSRAARNNNQQGASILMMNGGGGADGVSIIDSGAAVHASGNRFLFTQYGPVPAGKKLYAANREEMPCAGYGSIRIPSLGMELGDVYHVPSLGNKTIISVAELNELGYGVILRKDCRIIEDERTWPHKVVGEAHLVNGQFVLDYLKISLNRAPVADGTLTLMWRDVWMRWNRFTEFLFQRDERLPR